MKISFLGSSARIPAVKTFTSSSVLAYPQIRNFNSVSYDIEKSAAGLEHKVKLLQKHSADGDCTLKGYLTKDLANESRAGMVDSQALTENLVMDIDGITIPHTVVNLPLDKRDLELLSEKIISYLPDAFQSVSYIVHASSSMGMKGNKVCLHMDFLLQDAVAPQALKEYVSYLNHAIPLFEQNFSLSASCSALRFPLDRSVVDNSHLVFLGTPLFEDGISNPIPNDEDRIFLVKKSGLAININNEIRDHCDTAKSRKDNNRKLNELRDLAGLPMRKAKTSTILMNGKQVNVVTNPEHCKLTFAADNGNFVAYNVNGGNSGGYYVHKFKPNVVHNFKGEPNFLFEMADPETYQWHLERFIGTGDANDVGNSRPTPPMPMVFRDMETDVYYNVLINTTTGLLDTAAKAQRGALEDFMTQHEAVMPAAIPTWDYKFDPQNDSTINYQDKFINKYVPSEFWRSAEELPAGMAALDYETSMQLSQYCPTIFEIILHVLNRDTELFKHFLNWLAAAFQQKDKLGTAWILQGVQGTGKGILFDSIITPLAGTGAANSQPYTNKVRLENLEESFNNWIECSLFVAFDEFRLDDSINGKKLFNKIKGMITEKYEPIRGMRENLRTVRTYSNYLVFSNDLDVITIPADDRRFNVGGRQEHKIETLFDNMQYIIDVLIPSELQNFACAMAHYKVDTVAARAVLENEAKKQMRIVSQSSISDFVHAFQHGDLEFFIPVLDMPYNAPNGVYVLPAQTIIKGHLRDMEKGDMHKVSIEELRILYCALISAKSENAMKFSKLIGRHGLRTTRLRINNIITRGFQIQWNLANNTIEDLRERYLTSVDYSFEPDKATNVVAIKEAAE